MCKRSNKTCSCHSKYILEYNILQGDMDDRDTEKVCNKPLPNCVNYTITSFVRALCFFIGPTPMITALPGLRSTRFADILFPLRLGGGGGAKHK